MKKLIKNNFIYYTRSIPKILISIAFIISLLSMLKLYDNLEVFNNAKLVNETRFLSDAKLTKAYQEVNSDYLEEIDYSTFLYTRYNHFGERVDNNATREQLEQEREFDKLALIEMNYSKLRDDLATIYGGGRMSYGLTFNRLSTAQVYLEIYDNFEISIAENAISQNYNLKEDYIRQEVKRLTILNNSNTPDDFNEYTVTFSNLLSKMFDSLFLFTILVFSLLLYYDLFSKDYHYKTYRLVFSEGYSRYEIILSKILFAILYTMLLITMGLLLISINLIMTKRVGYNVNPSRMGYIFHPYIINVNPLTIFNFKPLYIIIPAIVKNIIVMISGTLIITMWILLISTISFKSKSSSTTLTMGVFILLTMLFTNFTFIKYYVGLIVPLYAFNIERFMNGISKSNFIIVILTSIAYSYILFKVITKNIDTIDLLDGDSND